MKKHGLEAGKAISPPGDPVRRWLARKSHFTSFRNQQRSEWRWINATGNFAIRSHGGKLLQASAARYPSNANLMDFSCPVAKSSHWRKRSESKHSIATAVI
jgi:hypothetical protein